MYMLRPAMLAAFVLLAAVTATAQTEEDAPAPNDLLIDATYVPCSDSTESLYIFQDGRVIYAWFDRGVIFNINGALLADLQRMADAAESYVETKRLDSCSTIGVILDDHRYLLINSTKPAPATVEMEALLERLRKYARRKLESTIDRLTTKAASPDTTIESDPTAASAELGKYIYASPVAQEWRCRGSVIVRALIGVDGRVRQAFIEENRVRGKCASLLGMSALRAALLTPFKPASGAKGKPMTGWIRAEIAFGRRSAGNK